MSKIKVLKNGLRAILIPFAGTETATVLVMVKVGSRYETPGLSGASHFIEHMMFKGTKRRPTTLDISKELDSVGASYNAFTGKNYTGYFAKVPAEHFSLAVDLLHDMIFHSKYAPAELARERKVIIEEIKMYEENPIMHIEDLLEEKLFEGSTLAWNIAGTKASMMKMKRAELVAFRDDNYTPGRLVLAAAGRLPERAEEIISRTFGGVKTLRGVKASGFIPYKSNIRPPCSPKAVIQNKDTEQIQLALGFPSPGLRDEKNDLLAEVLGVILGGTMSSRLFIAVRERKGLAYYVRAEQNSYDDVGVFTVRAGLDRARLPMAAKIIFKELEEIKKNGPSPAELKLAKNYWQGKMKLHMEDSSVRANFYARQELLLDKYETLEALCKKIQRITTKEVQEIANRILSQNNMTVAGIGPFVSEKALLRVVGL
jgi:predicted Zn-dependent peptidase